MQIELRDGIGITTAAIAFAGFVVALMIKNDQLQSKNESDAKYTRIEADVSAKHAETEQRIAVHVAEDTLKFDAISRTLTRIDGKLDRISGRE